MKNVYLCCKKLFGLSVFGLLLASHPASEVREATRHLDVDSRSTWTTDLEVVPEEAEAKPVLVVDFDNTFIPLHCGGHPVGCELRKKDADLFPELERTKELLTGILEQYGQIIINTRGIQSQTEKVLKDAGLMPEFISKVYGAAVSSEINPYRTKAENDAYWSERKVGVLQSLAEDLGEDLSQLKFYDDTLLNVTKAKEFGFSAWCNSQARGMKGNKLLEMIATGVEGEPVIEDEADWL